jgi:CHASE3 domain sensor protein
MRALLMKDNVKMIRQITLQAGALALLALTACNAFLAMRHLGRMEKVAAFTIESSTIQADISDILKDLTDMETGQRGYLLTANLEYEQPYTDAKGRIAADFARLRRGLGDRPNHERSLELELESLASSKEAEIEQTIDLRQRGYRRRAFKRVDSGEGKEYMDKARALLSSLSAGEAGISAELNRERKTIVNKARTSTIIDNLCLLVLTACLFGLSRFHAQVLEREAARSKQELAIRDLQLQKLTTTLSNQARFKTCAIETNASLLLQEYGGFLPRAGHECAEQIQEAAAQVEKLRQELVGIIDQDGVEQPVYELVA